MLDKTKDYKIDVSALTTAERTKLQEQLFLLGYKWFDGGQKVSELDADVLFLSPDMELSFGGSKSFSRYDYPILTVSDIMPQTEERTLRDWFAGQALAGFTVGLGGYLLKEEYSAYTNGACNSSIANRCYALADLMLKERNK